MVAYSFMERFIEPIRAGTKIGTIRALGKRRHARPGEQLQLYYHQRRPDGFKIIDDVTCLRVNEIRLDLTGKSSFVLTSNGVPIEGWDAVNQFARADGFEDFAAMLDFWEQTHGPILFEGAHIIWRETPANVIEVPIPCIKRPENA